MTARPSDEEFARLAASHSLHDAKTGEIRQKRIDDLRAQGVTDEKSLAEHTLKVMRAPDTQCFRGAYGREVYANDRMNTLVFTHETNPEKSTVYYNNMIDDPLDRKTATQRLEGYKDREKANYPGLQCEIRTGGSKALEEDRAQRPLNSPPQSRPPTQQERLARQEARSSRSNQTKEGRGGE